MCGNRGMATVNGGGARAGVGDFIMGSWRGWAAACCLLSTAVCDAKFYGYDSLATDLGNWRGTPLAGGGAMAFQKSRLEYLVENPAASNGFFAMWLPNAGAVDEEWFVQVDVHLDMPTIPNESFLDLGLQVESWPGGAGVCYHSMSRVRTAGKNHAGFVFWNETGGLDSFDSRIKQATLRLHHDPVRRTLTGSVSDGTLWVYTSPLSVSGWGMKKSDQFVAGLTARNEGPPFLVPSGAVYFKNFRAGAARPAITVEQPVRKYIRDGKATTSFGVAKTGKSKTKVYLIRNQGTKALQKLRVRIDGAAKKDFQLAGGLKSNVLMPGAAMKLKIRFTAKEKGARRAKLHILSDDPAARSFDVGLVGKGR